MSPAEFRMIRERAGLDVDQCADFLRVEPRSVQRYEEARRGFQSRRIPGPVAKLMELLDADKISA